MKFFIIAISFGLLASCVKPEPSPITWNDCGGLVGDHACDFSLKDQHGDEWSLYDHYGNIIVLDFSTMWCGYCQKAAQVAQHIQNAHKTDGVIWVTILLQNNYGQVPSLGDLNEWTKSFDMTSSPVLSGSVALIDHTAEDGFNVTSWPGIVVIDRDMTIAYELAGWNESQIKFWLDRMTAGQQDAITPP